MIELRSKCHRAKVKKDYYYIQYVDDGIECYICSKCRQLCDVEEIMVNKKVKVKEVILDDKLVRKVCCPGCGVWGIIDDDQFHGRVSILCECGFHETTNLAELFPKVPKADGKMV